MGWHVVWSQWPVVFVWLVLVLPYLAASTPKLAAPDSPLQPFPWWLRALFWALRHVWPYSRIVRMGEALDRLFDEDVWTCPNCGVRTKAWRKAVVAGHLLTYHFPGESMAWAEGEALWQYRQQVLRDDWFTPPPGMTPEQAERWMEQRAAQLATGGRPWARTSFGSTSASPPA